MTQARDLIDLPEQVHRGERSTQQQQPRGAIWPPLTGLVDRAGLEPATS